MTLPPPTLDELNLLHSQMCQAVADVKRIQIMYALYEKARNVTSLAETLETPQPTISRHLALLRERGLVVGERDGSWVIFRLTDERVIAVLDIMRQMLRATLSQRTHAMEST
jgi:DNA-binding transcriptional ArsR family regulator